MPTPSRPPLDVLQRAREWLTTIEALQGDVAPGEDVAR